MLAQNLKSKTMECVDDEGAVDAAALPLAQAKTGVEHVVLQQDALAHPEDLHYSGDVEDNNMLMMVSYVSETRIFL